ncbi:MAG: hypothetical protein N3A02_06945, partial [Rectinema sp.]|nr:hypothetical protein [Rectinema sp.]
IAVAVAVAAAAAYFFKAEGAAPYRERAKSRLRELAEWLGEARAKRLALPGGGEVEIGAPGQGFMMSGGRRAGGRYIPEGLRQVSLMKPGERKLFVFDPSTRRMVVGSEWHYDLASKRLGKTSGVIGGGIERVSEGVFRLTSRTSSLGDVSGEALRGLRAVFREAGFLLE